MCICVQESVCACECVWINTVFVRMSTNKYEHTLSNTHTPPPPPPPPAQPHRNSNTHACTHSLTPPPPHTHTHTHLQHEQTGVVKEAGHLWLEEVDGPNVNEGVDGGGDDLALVKQMKVTTQAQVFVHLQAVSDHHHILSCRNMALVFHITDSIKE